MDECDREVRGQVCEERSRTSRCGSVILHPSASLEIPTFSADLEPKERVTVTFARSRKSLFGFTLFSVRSFFHVNQRDSGWVACSVCSLTVKQTASGPGPPSISILEKRSPLHPIRQSVASGSRQKHTPLALRGPQSPEGSSFLSLLIAQAVVWL